MPLHLILGPSGAGTSTHAARLAERHLQQGLRGHVLTPPALLNDPWEHLQAHPRCTCNRQPILWLNPTGVEQVALQSLQMLTKQSPPCLTVVDFFLDCLPDPLFWNTFIETLQHHNHPLVFTLHTEHEASTLQEVDTLVLRQLRKLKTPAQEDTLTLITRAHEAIQVNWPPIHQTHGHKTPSNGQLPALNGLPFSLQNPRRRNNHDHHKCTLCPKSGCLPHGNDAPPSCCPLATHNPEGHHF